MIVWTGKGTLLDTAGPHHTLTIQKNTYMTIQTKQAWLVILVTRTWGVALAFGGFVLSIKLT